ncbi:MAG: DUF4139 domain-containing protein [Phototrophicales bacterium]
MIILLAGVFGIQAQEDTDDDSDVAVTVYNQGTALIRDRRSFDLSEGVNQVDFTDVASSIDATSVSFVSLSDPDGTFVLEQNYVYDLVGTGALLERYIDQVITVTTSDGSTFSGVLLSGRGDIILQDEGGQVTVVGGDDVRNISFPALPDGLITRPTLRWLVFSSISGRQDVELTYLTGGISWTADYNILLNTDNTSLDLNGWITLTNTSGTSYDDAQLKLVAGDVNRIAPEDFYYIEEQEMMAMDRVAAAPAGVEQREFFEYQLYEIGRPVTIGNNETKQVEFVTGSGITANTYYVYDGSDYFYGYYSPITDPGYGLTGITDVQNYLEFSTGEESGLGADLPAGRVRVYQEDVDGAALLIGENRIEHTPEGEEINIYLGNAFDLVGERIQTDFNLVANNVLQETYEIHLRNRKDDDTVEIRVPERLFRWSNWEILSTSHDYTQLDSATIEFRVDVPPGEEVVITYTVQYSWPR